MKITIDKAVLEQALDALEKALPITREQLYAIISLREALAQPAAQPTEPAKDIGVEQDERVFARIADMKPEA